MPPERPLIELTYYETYYFANAVKNVLEHRFDYLRHLDGFYGDGNYLALVAPFRKYSAFHAFIEFLIDGMVADEVNEVKLDIRQDTLDRLKNIPIALEAGIHPAKLPVNVGLDRYGIEHQSFEEWLKERGTTFMDACDNDIEDYYDSLREDGTWDELLSRATREVFFRDRGLCVLCHRDLTGIVNIWSEDNFDHIVPLAAGGLNDVSNIQLLCRECNSKKRAGTPVTSNHYEAWSREDDQ